MRSDKDYFMGIDFGTQGVRCGIVDENGEIIFVCHSGFNTYYPEPGWAVQKPNEWIDSMVIAASGCLEKAGIEIVKNIKGISVCATASTSSAGNGRRNGFLWMRSYGLDNRANMEANGINETQHEILNILWQ